MNYKDFCLLYGKPSLPPLRFRYNGEDREVVPISIKAGAKEWALFAYDMAREDYRMFKLSSSSFGEQERIEAMDAMLDAAKKALRDCESRIVDQYNELKGE
jgi:predicted DNA-binding transcriptional regulator YafY